jgi:hypothetical protein
VPALCAPSCPNTAHQKYTFKKNRIDQTSEVELSLLSCLCLSSVSRFLSRPSHSLSLKHPCSLARTLLCPACCSVQRATEAQSLGLHLSLGSAPAREGRSRREKTNSTCIHSAPSTRVFPPHPLALRCPPFPSLPFIVLPVPLIFCDFSS